MIKKIKFTITNIAIPLLLIFACTLVFLEFITHTNFILEELGLNYVKTFTLALILNSIVLISKPKKFYKKHWKKIFFIFPILLYSISVIVYMRYHQFFIFLEKEDSVIEWLQFIFIIFNAILSFLLFRFWKNKNKFLKIIFTLAIIGFFLIAGEEISWGQRIFNLETPEAYREINTQSELTVHNYGPLFGLVYRGYMLIGIFGATGWILKKLFLKITNKNSDEILDYLVPSWYYFIYFTSIFLYNYIRFIIYHIPGDGLWEEAMELLLFIAISLFLLEQYLKTKKELFSQSNQH